MRGAEIPNPLGDLKLGNRTKQYEKISLVVKYYAGEGAALTSPTASLAHFGDVIGYTLGAKVNVANAKVFINSTSKKECKK